MAKIELTTLQQKIDTGVKQAIAQALEKHRRLGQSIVISQDGQIVKLSAAQIPVLENNEK